jgi:hypothetical protein
MKMDLTPRDIEYLLLLVNEMIADKMDMNDPEAVSIDEMMLVEKLETALNSMTTNEHDIFGGKSTNMYH